LCGKDEQTRATARPGGSVEEYLPDVFVFESRVLLPQLVSILGVGEDVQDALHGEACSADAWLSVHHRRIDRDSFERQVHLLAKSLLMISEGSLLFISSETTAQPS
jgi:hypothetical protein